MRKPACSVASCRQSARGTGSFLRYIDYLLHYGVSVDPDHRSRVDIRCAPLFTQLRTPDLEYRDSSFPLVRDQPICAADLVDRGAARSGALMGHGR